MNDPRRPPLHPAGDDDPAAEDALEVSEKRLVQVLETISDGFLVLGRDWRITSMNAAAERINGQPREELLGRSHWDVYPATVDTALHRHLERVMVERVAVHFENYYAPWDRWFDVDAYPTTDGGIALCYRDITERKRGAQELARVTAASERRKRLYETILANTPDLAYVFDLDHRFIYVNEGLLRMWGKTWDEAIGKTCLELGYEPWHAEMHDREIEQVKATRRSVRGEVPFTGTFGRRIYDYIFVPVLGPDGAVEAVAGTTRDVTERKETEERLRASEERVRLAVGAAGVGYFEWHFDSDVCRLDAICASFFGVAPHTTGAEVFGRIEPADRSAAEAAVQAAAEGGTAYRTEFRVRRPDGSVRWLSGEGNVARDPSGRAVSLRGVNTDITARKQAEDRERRLLAETAEANAKFRAFFEQGSLFAGIIAVDGTTIEPNHAALAVGGYTREQMIGRPFWEAPWWAPSPALAGRVRALVERAAAGEPVREELPYYVADGGERVVDFMLVPIRDADGRIVFLGPAGIDVTDRKRAEEALRASEERFRAFMNHSPTSAWVTDADGRVRYVSATYARMFRLPDRELVGAAPTDLYPEEFVGEYVANIRAVADSGRPIETIERGPRPDGSVGRFLVYKFPLPGGERLVGGVAVDISERLDAEEKLREANRRKDEFLATLAHELRNPLAPIRNGLYALRRGAESGERLLEMMERQLGHLVHLVDDLLDVSRVTSGKITLRTERLDLRDALDAALETCRPALAESRHAFDLRLPDGPLPLDGDRTRLAQVFSNILTNACKYTPDGGRVTLTAERDGAAIVVRVADTGIGIPADMLPKVFEVFVQLGRAIERSHGGLGLGLALVKRLVEMHGGSVWAESEGPGRGSTFVVRLALAGGVARAEPARGPATDPAPAAARRVLVVDDNQDAADSLALILQMFGHDAVAVYDGPEALHEARRFRPDVAFLDIGLPGMTGYELARAFRGDPVLASTVLIALTGWGTDEDRREAKEAGFQFHLTKPAEADKLAELLGRLTAAKGPAHDDLRVS